MCICCAVEVSVMVIFMGVTMAHISRTSTRSYSKLHSTYSRDFLPLPDLPVESTATGCYYAGIFSVSALFWLPALVFEPVLCLLVLWKSWGEDALEKWRLDTKSKPESQEQSSHLTTSPLVKRLAKERCVVPTRNSANSCYAHQMSSSLVYFVVYVFISLWISSRTQSYTILE